MDAILFSIDPKMANMSDVIVHLQTNDQLYFEVKFPIRKEHFSFPLSGFIHVKGDKVRYVVAIEDIVPFSIDHYESPLANFLKPTRWLFEWKNNTNNCRFDLWKNALVITNVTPFEYETSALQKYTGGAVVRPPQNYIRILPPISWRDEV